MTDETTSEQLAEIDRDMADIDRQVAELEQEAANTDYKTQELPDKTQELPEYTPPEGWRLVPLNEPLKGGDEYHAGLDRYIRPIESQPQPVPVQVREGRWRTRHGWVRNVTPTPEGDGREQRFPWWDAQYRQTWTADGRYHFGGASALDLVEYLGPIEPDKTQELEGKTQELQAAAIEELRSEVSYVQRLLGESRQRVTQLEELVASLRTINRGCENAVRDAGKENFALKNQLEAVKAELAQVSKDRYALQSELDAAQQVPADSPEIRQLRADLEQVTLGRDTYRDGYDRVLSDLVTARKTAKAEAVEAIAEWLEPIRAVDHPNLANETLQHLPQIMRHLTGLDSHAID